MIWKTHMVGGIQAGLIMAAVTAPDPQTAGFEIGAAVVGSILPDIDCPTSKISKSDIGLGLISRGIAKVTKHRRATHTVWCSFLFALIAFLLMKAATVSSVNGFSILVGLALMIVIDFLGGRVGSLCGIVAIYLVPQINVLSSLQGELFNLPENCVMVVTLGVLLGCISHLVYDSANPQGIMWLHPINHKRFHFTAIQTESKGETFFRIIMLILAVGMFVVINPFQFTIPTIPNIGGIL